MSDDDTPNDWVQRMTSLPDDAVAIVLSDDAVPDGEDMRELIRALPRGSAVVMLTAAQRAVLDHARAVTREYHPERLMHGPHTRSMWEHIESTAIDLHVSDSESRVMLLDNGFGGLLIAPPDAIVYQGALPDDHPLIALVREHLAHGLENPPSC